MQLGNLLTRSSLTSPEVSFHVSPVLNVKVINPPPEPSNHLANNRKKNILQFIVLTGKLAGFHKQEVL
jgi:hypothetical protein